MKSLCAVVFLLTMLATAQAENIRLRAGSIDFPNVLAGDGPVHLEGRDFVFDGYAQSARLDAVDCAFPCSPGETVSLLATASGNDLPGVVTWKGTEYTDVGSLVSPNQMTFLITGRMTLPRIGRDATKTKTVRVKFTGSFYHAEVPLALGAQETLVARAIATVTLNKIIDPLGEEAWVVSSLSYDIVR
jgi:hypothetical protein